MSTAISQNALTSPQHKEPGEVMKIMLGILVLLVMTLSTILYFAYGMSHVVDEQLSAMQAGDIAKAYSLCSSQFKQHSSLEDFNRYVQNNPILSHHKRVTFTEKKVENGAGFLNGVIEGVDTASFKIEYQLVKENDLWMIQFIRLSPMTADSSAAAPASSNTSMNVSVNAADNVPANVPANASNDALTNASTNASTTTPASASAAALSTASNSASNNVPANTAVNASVDSSASASVPASENSVANAAATSPTSTVAKAPVISTLAVVAPKPASILSLNDATGMTIHAVLINDVAGSNGYVQAAKRVLSAKAPMIYATVQIIAPKSGGQVEAVLIQSNGAKIGPAVGTLDKSGNVMKAFTFARAGAVWPKGKYSVLVNLSSGKTKTTTFEVK